MITGRIGAERKFSKNPKAMHGAIVGLPRLKANRIDRLSRFASRMGGGTQSSNTDNGFIDRPETHWMEDELHNDEQRYKRDVPYQSLIKTWLAEKIRMDRRRTG